MSDHKPILASAIGNVPHFVAFDMLVKKRFSEVQLDKLLIYIIDTVDSSALPALAAQFDVLGYKGLKLATTEEQQREVIKRAIEIKRRKGTVWAVKEALKAIGYPDAKLIEHAGTGPGAWATFRIEIDGGSNVISITTIGELIKMIDEYKPERSHLLDLSYTLELDDDITVSEESDEIPSVDVDDSLFAGGDFRYNGQYAFNGEMNYSSDTDIIEIQIINL